MEILGYHVEKKVSNCFTKIENKNRSMHCIDDETMNMLKNIGTLDSVLLTYEIYKNGEDVGFVEFRDIETLKPKIGVEIKEKFRRQGIAYTLIGALMKKVCEEKEIKYFVYQVQGKNEASIRLAEKLGGVFHKSIEVKDIISIYVYHILP